MDNLTKHSEYCIGIQDQPPLSLGKDILLTIKRWHQNSVTRRHLKDLPDYLLDDLGINKQLAKKETDKAFWE
ncbi:DUF1127 domain-containing protein [Vibrio sp. C8]